jgi:hypothetical protein
MLRSFVSLHGFDKQKIIIMENSTNEETAIQLTAQGIPFFCNQVGTHSPALSEALKLCQTKYALVVDSDIVFKKNITPLLNVLIHHEAAIMGTSVGNVGQYRLKRRICPWFFLVDIEQLKVHKISFHNQAKIDSAIGSEHFFKNIPFNPNANNRVPMYDVGSTFYEDITEAKLKILDLKTIEEYYLHFAGASWMNNINAFDCKAHYKTQNKLFKEIEAQLANINIKNIFEA